MTRPNDQRIWLVAALSVSAFGGWYHNVQEFPDMGLMAPEMVSTIAPAAILAVWWLIRPGRAVWWATLAWIALNLVVGAVLSVLPLPILPFTPAQTAEHYMSHLLYGVTQTPALYGLWITRPLMVPAR